VGSPLATTTMSSVRPDQPHLVSLVLQSKKALQHGEQLCSRANSLSNASAQCAVDVMALDAKVKWISAAVLDQLNVYSNLSCLTILILTTECIVARRKCRKEYRAEASTTGEASSGTLLST